MQRLFLIPMLCILLLCARTAEALLPSVGRLTATRRLPVHLGRLPAFFNFGPSAYEYNRDTEKRLRDEAIKSDDRVLAALVALDNKVNALDNNVKALDKKLFQALVGGGVLLAFVASTQPDLRVLVGLIPKP